MQQVTNECLFFILVISRVLWWLFTFMLFSLNKYYIVKIYHLFKFLCTNMMKYIFKSWSRSMFILIFNLLNEYVIKIFTFIFKLIWFYLKISTRGINKIKKRRIWKNLYNVLYTIYQLNLNKYIYFMKYFTFLKNNFYLYYEERSRKKDSKKTSLLLCLIYSIWKGF